MSQKRCQWVSAQRPEELAYHDEEWGVPVHEDRMFFECLVLEGAQAGLSWYTVLKKRGAYRAAFANFEVATVAEFGAPDVARMLDDVGLIRHRGKLEAAIHNAHCFLALQQAFGSFDAYVWRFVDGLPRAAPRRLHGAIPASTPESIALAKDLKNRGFKFFGPTTAYAFMQATGLVNDHLADCFRYGEIAGR